jgi:flagellar FliL protein
MKKILPIVVLLVALGGVYKFVLAKPGAAAPKPKVDGTVYMLQKEFLVNLADGRYAKLTVGLVLKEGDTSSESKAKEGATPPEGFGTMPEEGVVRDIITNDLTDKKDSDLVDPDGRDKVKAEILKDLKKHTDVGVTDILFTDVTVQ